MDNSKAADKKQSKLYLEKLVATKWDGKMKNKEGGGGGYRSFNYTICDTYPFLLSDQ